GSTGRTKGVIKLEGRRLGAVGSIAVDSNLVGSADEDVVQELSLVGESAEEQLGTALGSAVGGEGVVDDNGPRSAGRNERGDSAALSRSVARNNIVDDERI